MQAEQEKKNKNKDKNVIIVALDFDDKQKALELVEKLDPNRCRLKVGKEMFTLFGAEWVTLLINKGFDVFLDLKFHDIPNTVAKACVAAAKLGVWMVNIHATGGREMMQTAKKALDEHYQEQKDLNLTNGSNVEVRKTLLIAVTVLTSMNEETFGELGYQRSLPEQVTHLAKIAQDSGLDGVVCSAKEAEQLTKILGKSFALITPGIRPANSSSDDQTRIMTPEKAILAGSSYLVIGRPITQASDPLKALCDISESLASL
ncbi:MAG: orotidine-5'-phosphate decarboxylase [Gammaproteobacteria bacterium]|nr:MAG: orotidine-5'-phosphate decarboxylase [Gammaproteobacteria bacterium]